MTKGSKTSNFKVGDLLKVLDKREDFVRSDTLYWFHELHTFFSFIIDKLARYNIYTLPEIYDEAVLKKITLNMNEKICVLKNFHLF